MAPTPVTRGCQTDQRAKGRKPRIDPTGENVLWSDSFDWSASLAIATGPLALIWNVSANCAAYGLRDEGVQS